MRLKILRDITAGGKLILEKGQEIIAIAYLSRFLYKHSSGKELLPKDSYEVIANNE